MRKIINNLRVFLIRLLVGKTCVMMNLKLINITAMVKFVKTSTSRHAIIDGCDLETGKWSKGLDNPDSDLKVTLRPNKGR